MILRDLGQGYFCADDVISIGAMSALRRAGYRIPEQVGIIGFNDMEMAGWIMCGSRLSGSLLVRSLKSRLIVSDKFYRLKIQNRPNTNYSV